MACSGGDKGTQAFESVEWHKLDESQCVTKGGQMVAVQNKHKSKSVDVVLDRWYMGKKTPDRGHHRLAPGEPPMELGCSETDGAEQKWELVSAQFVP
jgi:hypothetical protein